MGLNRKQKDIWDLEIKPQSHLLNIDFKELWGYRDLLRMFVKRDIVTVYKQTVLGPIWFVIQPILTTLTYIIVFGNIAQISTDGLPKGLFYLSGVVLWNYFSESLNSTSKTFMANAQIFGKVYFPRLIMPLTQVISGLIKFGIQFTFFLTVLAYFLFFENVNVSPNGYYILIIPVLLLLMAGLGLGCGVIFTSLTSKYRDLTFLIQFGVQLLMYGTPVIYPLSSTPEKYRMLIMLNPMTPILEAFRYTMLGTGAFNWGYLAYSAGAMVVLLTVGIIIFSRVEKTFMDTV